MSGQRATQAAARLSKLGFQNLTVVDGGMLAWSAAGLPVEKGTSKVWSLERQVRFTAGLIVLVGVLLATFVHPYFIALSGFIGAGLVFALGHVRRMFCNPVHSCRSWVVRARCRWCSSRVSRC